ncbi:hypothetical protein O166_07930 [Pseudogulbenkiania ferrooxidans EGD-HP2]|uniref:Uncharacterized protein n=1 Tax=Pseudogulbenkiania ferrooxidans EGD-HP2 TaxID=1388764 RepID=A0ABN0N6I9_9NEIS|nr:hypothetical protein O166_07930 [Pseudogulbenkiania ferrooxidans EGD-HP2]
MHVEMGQLIEDAAVLAEGDAVRAVQRFDGLGDDLGCVHDGFGQLLIQLFQFHRMLLGDDQRMSFTERIVVKKAGDKVVLVNCVYGFFSIRQSTSQAFHLSSLLA